MSYDKVTAIAVWFQAKPLVLADRKALSSDTNFIQPAIKSVSVSSS